MRCAWEEYLKILPPKMREAVDRQGRGSLQELRLRLGHSPQMIRHKNTCTLNCEVTTDDLLFVINTASQYSPWTAQTLSHGYITAPGGHRIGICGECAVQKSGAVTIRSPVSMCIRVARDFEDLIADPQYLFGSVLILGAPGWGKTTLLRDLIRYRSREGSGSICVVDERGELFPYARGRPCFSTGDHTDVLTGCGKAEGVDMLLRTMGPGCIAVDEITSAEDCKAMMQAVGCGVSLLATAHAASVNDLYVRPVYRLLMEEKLFQKIILLSPEKSWKEVAITA